MHDLSLARPYDLVRMLANIAERVHETRRAAGLSLRAFGEVCGLSASYLCEIEHGQADPTLRTLTKLALACGVTEAELCSGVVPFTTTTYNDSTTHGSTYAFAGPLHVRPAGPPSEALPVAARIGFQIPGAK